MPARGPGGASGRARGRSILPLWRRLCPPSSSFSPLLPPSRQQPLGARAAAAAGRRAHSLTPDVPKREARSPPPPPPHGVPFPPRCEARPRTRRLQRAAEPRGGEEAGLGAVHPEVPGSSASAFVGDSLAPRPSPGGEKERLDWMSREVPTRRRCGGGDVRICRLAFHTELAARQAPHFCVLWRKTLPSSPKASLWALSGGLRCQVKRGSGRPCFLFVRTPSLPASL